MNPLSSLDLVLLLALFAVGVILAILFVRAKRSKNAERLVELIGKLRRHPLDDSVRREFQRTILSVSTLDAKTSSHAYKTALNILAANPCSDKIREFALDVGIWHYSRMRIDKKLTALDEATILNDVLACTKGPVTTHGQAAM